MKKVSGKRILLLDDVFTTGSTANACARELFSRGAAAVYVFTLARALEAPDGSPNPLLSNQEGGIV
jgi:predicted amidophosphoribosyltransferase